MRKVLFVFVLILYVISMQLNCLGEDAVSFSLQAESYDFSADLDWGYPDLNAYKRPNESIMNSAYQRSNQWMKCWIRVIVSPHLEWSPTGINDDFDLSTYGNYAFENIRISNMNSIGIYPSQTMLFSANPTNFEGYHQDLRDDGDLWYLEVLIDKRNRTENEIDNALKTADILTDIIIRNETSASVVKNCRIDLNEINRISLSDNNVSITLQDIYTVDIPPHEIMSTYFNDIEPWNDDMTDYLAQKYKCYQLDLTVTNHSQRRIFFPKISKQSDNTWIMYFSYEFETVVFCDAGETITLDTFYLVTDQNIDTNKFAVSKQYWPLKIRICNEVAGYINEYNESLLVHHGIPFDVFIQNHE